MTYSHMVALGSSFAAGPGIEPVADRRAMRSERNYAHLVARALSLTLTDATVSGATTTSILDDRQRTIGRTFPPQIEAVHPKATLVTITAGGNDLGYVGGILGTALLQRISRHPVTRPAARIVRARFPLSPVAQQRAQATADGLFRIAKTVQVRAPRARIVLVDYLPIFTAETVPGPHVPFSIDEIAHFRQIASALSAAFASAAERSGVELLPAVAYNQAHGIGTADAWVSGLNPGLQLASSFHPTAAGMEAVAQLLVRMLKRPEDN